MRSLVFRGMILCYGFLAFYGRVYFVYVLTVKVLHSCFVGFAPHAPNKLSVYREYSHRGAWVTASHFPLYRHCKRWPNWKVSSQPSKQVTRYTGPCLRQRRCRRTRTWCVLRCCCLAFCREWYDQGTSPLSFLRKLVLFAEFCIWSSFAIEVRLWVRVRSESFWAGPTKVIRGRFRRGSGLVTYAYT